MVMCAVGQQAQPRHSVLRVRISQSIRLIMVRHILVKTVQVVQNIVVRVQRFVVTWILDIMQKVVMAVVISVQVRHNALGRHIVRAV